MRRILLTLILLLMTLNTTAQDTDAYRLRKPTAEEYLAAIPDVISGVGDDYFQFRNVIMLEFNVRYGHTSLSSYPYELLSAFQIVISYGADMQTAVYFEEWFSALLEAGFRDYGIQEISDQMSVGEFEIESTPVDFNGDDVNEYLLKVSDGTSGRIVYVLTVESPTGGYLFKSVPLPFTGLLSSPPVYPETGELETRQLADINQDGSTEWIVQGGDYGYWNWCGKLYVIDWVDGALVNLTGDLFSYCIPQAQLDSATNEYRYVQKLKPWDSDILSKLEMVEIRIDGWNCQREEVDSLTWTGEEYELETVTHYEDTVWCTLREADLAFLEKDYGLATNLYEQALNEYQFSEQMSQYLFARLALAYALRNRIEEAKAVLDNVTPTGQMGELIISLTDKINRGDVEGACQIAHDFFLETNESAGAIRRQTNDTFYNPYEWLPESYNFGTEWIDSRYFPLPDPKQAGCDPQMFVPSSTPDPTAEVQAIATPRDINDLLQWKLPNYLNQQQYGDAFNALDEALTNLSIENESHRSELLYWRALTLEQLGRDDEALTDYLAIMQTAPESPWAMLAAFHIEPVDG